MQPVKTRKQLAAEETQRVIVAAASRLFLEHGYNATSIGRIAAEAGVAVQTIYNAVGSKRDLLSRVLDFAAAGERAPMPVPQFMREQAESEPDPRRIIAQLVEFWRSALPRTAPVFRVIREAAASDPEIAALERGRSAQRLRNYRHAAQLLADRNALRATMTIDGAAAAIFAVGHPETYRALVIDGNWDDDAWSNWVQATLEAALLRQSPRARRPRPSPKPQTPAADLSSVLRGILSTVGGLLGGLTGGLGAGAGGMRRFMHADQEVSAERSSTAHPQHVGEFADVPSARMGHVAWMLPLSDGMPARRSGTDDSAAPRAPA